MNTNQSPPGKGLVAIALDLSSVEAAERAKTGVDFTEAKEALVDALLSLTEKRVTGEGPGGDVVYGVRPSLKFVSGFLLPRFDRTGQEDETSDIHIATLGQDLQIAAGESGNLVVRPFFSIYVRELPSWEEIADPRFDMMPQVQLSRGSRRLVEQRARTYIQQRLSEVPPVEMEVDEDRAGNDIAQAKTALDAADSLRDAQETEGVSESAEKRGEARAITESGARADKVVRARVDQAQNRGALRVARREAIASIRREAFDRAFRELGIFLVQVQGDSSESRPLTSADIADLSGNQATEPNGDADSVSDPGVQEPSSDIAESTAEIGGSTGQVRVGLGRIQDQHAAPQPIPYKWRRFELQLGEFEFSVEDEASRQRAVKDFGARVSSELDRIVGGWLATEAGQRDAYRRSERILPSQFKDSESWSRFLADLRSRRPATATDVRPDLTGVSLVLDLAPDFSDTSRTNLRIAIENGASVPSGQDATACEPVLFQVKFQLDVPAPLHRPLRLERVEPSYRFRDWLEYPAMGLNCGVRQRVSDSTTVSLETTWAPRYVQPRIDARIVPGVPTRYADLANPSTDTARLLALPDAYDAWIDAEASVDVGVGLSQGAAQDERKMHRRNIDAYRGESGFIRQGVKLLRDSQSAGEALAKGSGLSSEDRKQLTRRAIPWHAWLRMNETFAIYGQEKFSNWRLFQLAFILAHIPTFASRMPEYENLFDETRDELSASLLYFPTGGGKSEAFFGLLIFNLFLDRQRGKSRGVSALIRYPLRLLTLQQARRLTRIVVQAEMVRLRHQIPGAPFELGFWVGSGNTPNRVAQGFSGVPLVTSSAYADDSALLNPPDGDSASAAQARRKAATYTEVLESYDKLRICPCCGETTGMRKYPSQHGRIGIVCFNPKCSWNKANPPSPVRQPLPFLLTDDTIYQRAPSIILGTVDKLALIGQHDRTINSIVGMFGCARYMDPDSKHLFVPRGQRALSKADESGWLPVSPAFANGADIFNDPFPSMIIQDEGHLLDESLGTFSGLFETTLEQILIRLGQGPLKTKVTTWPTDKGSSDKRIRLAKIIAATATISDPDRQLRVLYQRETLRFPCPGPSLYESFYASPRQPLRPERRAYSAGLPERLRPEQSSPRMRTYVSIMTNGRSHTMTTSAVVSAYHLEITKLWTLLVDQQRLQDFAAEVTAALPTLDPLTSLRAKALSELVLAGNAQNLAATLLDLLRISLTYVTNKKGGDQIIETLQSQVERDQRESGIGDLPFNSELISGGVTVAEIQDVMQRAEGPKPGAPFDGLDGTLRNIVATSAISHGVDVDKFNAMFFAGLPTDVAEYIQASSRIGRSHVGFSFLIPTPQSRRDRYVVETHDQFHRFLERMIAPPAVQRWADAAIARMIPSALQAFLCGVIEQEVFSIRPDAQKAAARTFTTAASIKAWADNHPNGNYPAAVRAVTAFVLSAIGLDGRGSAAIGAATHSDHYRIFVENRVRLILDVFTRRADPSQLSNFWQSNQTRELRKPMTSLRDVDAGGVILAAGRDPYRGKPVNLETVRQVMKIIRGQRLAVRSDVDADPAPVDIED